MPCTRTAPERPRLEIADILRAELGDDAERQRLGAEQSAAVRDILRCRTARLGGHLEICSHCGFERPAENSCRNRHCPKCQALASARWVETRMRRVLPTHHFHVVFTLPAELHSLARRNRALVFELLLRAAAETLLDLARDRRWLGEPAQLGVTTVLHTWTRELRFHPHAHCIVSGGGLSLDQQRWVPAPADFLFPVRVLGALFRGKLLDALARARRLGRLALPDSIADDRALRRRLDRLYRQSWVVYAKRPFGGPEQVYRYLGRYTHRIAISNARLLSDDKRGVTFRTRGGLTATLPRGQFVRRFLDHVLPSGFVKIRHSGLLASGNVGSRLESARRLLAGPAELPTEVTPELDDDFRHVMLRTTGLDLRECPVCRQRSLERRPLPSRALAPARAPPAEVAA